MGLGAAEGVGGASWRGRWGRERQLGARRGRAGGTGVSRHFRLGLFFLLCHMCSVLSPPAPCSSLSSPASFCTRRVGREPVCRRAGPDVIYATPRYRPPLSFPRPSRCPLLSRAPTHKIRYSSHPGGADVIHARRARRASITPACVYLPPPRHPVWFMCSVCFRCAIAPYDTVLPRVTCTYIQLILSCSPRPPGPVLLSPPPRPLRPHDPCRYSP